MILEVKDSLEFCISNSELPQCEQPEDPALPLRSRRPAGEKMGGARTLPAL